MLYKVNMEIGKKGAVLHHSAEKKRCCALGIAFFPSSPSSQSIRSGSRKPTHGVERVLLYYNSDVYHTIKYASNLISQYLIIKI